MHLHQECTVVVLIKRYSYVLCLLMPYVLLVSGYTNLGKCPIREDVPLYCLISGCLALTAFVCLFVASIDGTCCENFWFVIGILCAVVHFGVQCWGSYLVFGYWSTWYKREYSIVAKNLCDEDTFFVVVCYSDYILAYSRRSLLCIFG